MLNEITSPNPTETDGQGVRCGVCTVSPNVAGLDRAVSEGVERLVAIALQMVDTDSATAKVLLRRVLRFVRRQSTGRSSISAEQEKGHLSLWQIRSAVRHVECRLPNKVSVLELAKVVKLSPSHFCRSFKQTTGVSPGAYIQHRRIEMAQTLLLNSDRSLADIAIACGLCDQAHLTRVFRRAVGMPPGKWRKANVDLHHVGGPALRQRADIARPDFATA